MNFDFENATSSDVPELVNMVIALRKITAETGTITTRAQSHIFRAVPPVVLVEVAAGLEMAENPLAAISGKAVPCA